MRKLYSHRNSLSMRGTTAIKDEHDKDVYLINGRWGMHADVMSVYDPLGNLEAEIKQKSLGMLPKFALYYHRQYAGSLRRYYGVSREMLFVKGLNWLILGNLLTFKYKVYHGRECIMTINEVESASGSYLEFTIAHQEDEALLLCVVAILDYWAKTGQRKKERLQIIKANLAFN